MIAAIKGGVTQAPAPTPAKITPFAIPRSAVGIQFATKRLELGNITASPAPSMKRTPRKRAKAAVKTPFGRDARTVFDVSMGIEAVSAVKTPHHRAPAVSTRLGPKRSASLPPGTWKIA